MGGSNGLFSTRFSCIPVTPTLTPTMTYTEEEIFKLENLFEEKDDLIWTISSDKNDILHLTGHNMVEFFGNLSENSKILVKNVQKSIQFLQMIMLVGLKLFGAIIFLM